MGRDHGRGNHRAEGGEEQRAPNFSSREEVMLKAGLHLDICQVDAGKEGKSLLGEQHVQCAKPLRRRKAGHMWVTSSSSVGE